MNKPEAEWFDGDTSWPEAEETFWEHCQRREHEEEYWSLRDAGRNDDGTGESYAERNL